GIYGPGSRRDVVLHIARGILRGRPFHIGDGRALRSWIYVETLVDAMLHAAALPELRGPFYVDDGQPVSRRELAAQIARGLGRPLAFRRVPAFSARAAAWVLERALPPLGVRAPFSSEGVQYATTALPLDTSRWKNTGFRPRFTLREAIAATIAWGRASGVLS